MKEVLMIYYATMIPIIVGIYLAIRYLFLKWYLYLNPWIREAKMSDFTGLRYFKKLYYFSTVIDKEVFSKAWSKYCLLTALWSIILFWIVLPYLIVAVDVENINPALFGIGFAVLFLIPLIVIHVIAIKELEPFYKEGLDSKSVQPV